MARSTQIDIDRELGSYSTGPVVADLIAGGLALLLALGVYRLAVALTSGIAHGRWYMGRDGVVDRNENPASFWIVVGYQLIGIAVIGIMLFLALLPHLGVMLL